MYRMENLTYRGRDAVSIATDRVEAVFFTEFGAKFVSLKNLKTGYEFLWQGRQSVHPVPKYGELYVENDLCGADDIFPSINDSFYPVEPWKGTPCPPHGELWSIPWTTNIEGDTLSFRTHGIRLPYSIERQVSFSSDMVLKFDYCIRNHSPFEMPGIWALHPLFNAGEDTKIVLPEGTDQVINTLNFENRLGKAGKLHSWPVTTDKDGRIYDLSRFEPCCGVCEKIFIHGTLNEGIIMLSRNKEGASLSLRFPPEQVPYLGIWKNQGGFLGQDNIAIEPATGTLDDVYVSRMWEQCSVLPADGTLDFWIEFTID